jgi:hypothetical protein
MDDTFEYRWGSNRPVIKTIMEHFIPKGVLELGVGKYSTPLLYSYNIPLVSIESDKAWIDEVKSLVPDRENFKLIHHDIGIHFKTKYQDISNEVKNKCVEFYKKYITPDLEFLFVDHVSGLRASSILGLFDKFKFIVYHDAEAKQFKNYNYHSITPAITKDYFHFMNQTPLVNTGIFIRSEYEKELDDFIFKLQFNNMEYCKKFDMEYPMNSVKPLWDK